MTEHYNVIKLFFANKTKCFNVELQLNGKVVTGLLDSRSSSSLINLTTYE